MIQLSKLTQYNIQKALMQDNDRDLAIVNHYPYNWFECDFLKITNSGYMYEYEIKLSRSDYNADKRKKQYDNKKQDYVTKHDKLRNGDTNGPSKFFFVVPTDMIKVDEVPEFAGLIYASTSIEGHSSYLMVRLTVVKEAPRLHKTKWDMSRIWKLAKAYQYRYLTNYFYNIDEDK